MSSRDYPQTPLFEDRLTQKFLRERHVLPVEDTPDHVALAMVYPRDDYAADAVRFAVGKAVIRRVALPNDLEVAFERLFGEGKSALRQIVDNTQARVNEGRDDDIDRQRTSPARRPSYASSIT